MFKIILTHLLLSKLCCQRDHAAFDGRASKDGH